MQNQLIARELGEGLWQWLQPKVDSTDIEPELLSGDSEALALSLPSSTTQVNLIMRGQRVVATRVQLDAKQRRHAAKLIPYELEEELSSSVDDLHFSFLPDKDDNVAVLYADIENCQRSFKELGEQGCDVRSALPDYLLLERPESGITLLLDENGLCARLSEHWGFTIEQELAPLVLSRLAEHSAYSEQAPEQIRLIAKDEESLEQLRSHLPDTWGDIEQDAVIGDYWSCLDLSGTNSALNLRRGALARSLPYQRWWSIWKKPSIVFAAVFAFTLLVNFVAYFSASSEADALREKINAVYLDAVPNGRLGDVERMLESKLSNVKKVSTDPSNFVFLIDKVSSVVSTDKDAEISSLSYNGDQRVLQLTIDFASLDKLSEFRTKLTERGVHSDSPRTTSIGSRYQARMKLREL
ncbi:type II secretion system protein GspL [Agaribacterium sp. ZY112]|uniref:type II secretion system protein GspL n=1 Tax=Agaribacterium sp. ZY112 TaxID=3233574 RepID=UPI0035248775